MSGTSTRTPRSDVHTPGPWTLRPSRKSKGAHYIEGGNPGWLVAEVSGQGDSNEANSRVIAAAPDLLAALIGMVEVLQPAEVDFNEMEERVMAQARAAIKKARGE